jgi:general nucleoside transport system permease protein
LARLLSGRSYSPPRWERAVRRLKGARGPRSHGILRADAAGLNIFLYRFAAIFAGSALVGLAGAYLSVVSAKIWIAGMTGGRGWIAVALVIFARWHPWRALAGALLFGGIEALIPQVAAAGVRVPEYFMLMTPYLATLAVMVWQGMRGRIGSDEPAALGQPYVREERS